MKQPKLGMRSGSVVEFVRPEPVQVDDSDAVGDVMGYAHAQLNQIGLHDMAIGILLAQGGLQILFEDACCYKHLIENLDMIAADLAEYRQKAGLQ